MLKFPMISFQFRLDVFVLFAFTTFFYGCSVESEHLIENIDEHKIITIYTKCDFSKSEGSIVKDHYLFKIKEKTITLTEKHGDRVTNKQSTNLGIERMLKDFVKIASNENDIIDDCKYYVKCGVKETRLYPTPEEILYLDQVILSFVDD